MKRLASEGFELVYLSTEDERLAAIRIYLTLGWKPLMYTEGMEERWQRIHQALQSQTARQHPENSGNPP